jgi:hypothetical protein
VTVATTPGGEIQPWDDDFGDLGMEDIGQNELSIPRLEIVHEEGIFRDRNSKAEYATLTGIILGVVKGRIMWAADVDDGDQPMCRSNNFEIGFPQMRTDIPAAKQFPWARSNFDPAAITPGPDGLQRLPCTSCRFKEWENNGFPDSKKPPCSELYHLPMLYEVTEGNRTPGILTVKSSAVKSIRKYITPFKSSRRPMFTALTEITLELSSRGKVKYSVPVFKRIGESDGSQWSEYAELYRSTREFLQRDPRPVEPKKPVASSTSATALEPDDPWATAPAAAPPDDAPWATPGVPAASPVPAATPAATAPPAVARPAAPAPAPAPAAMPPTSDLPF